jgi:hypothetical protein
VRDDGQGTSGSYRFSQVKFEVSFTLSLSKGGLAPAQTERLVKTLPCRINNDPLALGPNP